MFYSADSNFSRIQICKQPMETYSTVRKGTKLELNNAMETTHYEKYLNTQTQWDPNGKKCVKLPNGASFEWKLNT